MQNCTFRVCHFKRIKTSTAFNHLASHWQVCKQACCVGRHSERRRTPPWQRAGKQTASTEFCTRCSWYRALQTGWLWVQLPSTPLRTPPDGAPRPTVFPVLVQSLVNPPCFRTALKSKSLLITHFCKGCNLPGWQELPAWNIKQYKVSEPHQDVGLCLEPNLEIREVKSPKRDHNKHPISNYLLHIKNM